MRYLLIAALLLLSPLAHAGTLADLQREGVVIGLWDMRSGSLKDWSGNGHDGVGTDIAWSRDGASFPASTSMIVVPHADALNDQSVTLVALGNFMSQTTYEHLLEKEDATHILYRWNLVATPSVSVYDGTNARTVGENVTGHHCIATYIDDNETSHSWIDGVSVGDHSGAVDIYTNSADVTIGNSYAGGYPLKSTLSAIMMISRDITDTEAAAVYSELSAMVWPTKPWGTAKEYPSGAGNAVRFKTDWGIYIITGIGGAEPFPDSPIWVNSGNFGIVMDTIAGHTVKVINCATSGGFQLPTSIMHETPTQQAYGTWKFWLSHADASTTNVHFISPDVAGTAGYRLTITATEQIQLYEVGVEEKFITAAGYVSSGYHEYTITRDDVAGEFNVYMDGTFVDTATDNTTTTTTFWSWDIDTGDRVSWSDLTGDHSVMKQDGVNP